MDRTHRQGQAALPLAVDMDGTLLRTDMLHESAVRLFRNAPLTALRIPFWLARGKARLKAELASRYDGDAALLPVNEPFAAWLRDERRAGRQLVLATASDGRIARAVAERLGLFDAVLASDGTQNLGGAAKARALAARFGRGGFAYAGDARADLPVWREAGAAVLVNAPGGLARQLPDTCPVERVFPREADGLGAHLGMLRVHHWLKNLLLFIPATAAHVLADAWRWPTLLLGFLSFCLCASGVYLANDLLDLESDRRHPRKRDRALASGRASIAGAVLLAPFLICGAAVLGWAAGPGFAGWLCAYFFLTCLYSFFLKRLALLDALALSQLYTLRVLAGGEAAGVPVSNWLLTFSVFLFLSLAFLKRYAELLTHPPEAGATLPGRGYRAADAPLVATLGIGAAFASVLVLALYLNSEAVATLYRSPRCIWATLPVLLYWTGRMWLTAHRGDMHTDPLVFAVRDPGSLLAGLLFAAALAAGMVAWPW